MILLSFHFFKGEVLMKEKSLRKRITATLKQKSSTTAEIAKNLKETPLGVENELGGMLNEKLVSYSLKKGSRIYFLL